MNKLIHNWQNINYLHYYMYLNGFHKKYIELQYSIRKHLHNKIHLQNSGGSTGGKGSEPPLFLIVIIVACQ